MNFQGLQAKYSRLFRDNVAWKLLRADNAPYILAFLSDLFSENSEAPFSQARILLDEELIRFRELDIWKTETSAGTYLNKWIKEGWLREMNDVLTKTDASEIAIRFVQGLDEHNSGTTASHLRIVQDAVRDFAVAINSNVNERITLLKSRISEIQREIDALHSGVVIELTVAEQRERIREIYHLASILTGDFRRVEDEVRRLDQNIRIQIIEEDSTKGNILLSVLEKENLLFQTDAGSAFESFFHLLCDQHRTTELREQLRSILSRPVAKHLTTQQQQFLNRLMRELSRESERVFQIRRRIEESLRAYIESGYAQENRAVERLLNRLEKLAVELKNAGCNLQTETTLLLPTGTAIINSPDSMQLKLPDEKLNTSGVEENLNSKLPSTQMLDCLDTVQVRLIAEKILATLKKYGPMTIASIVIHNPIGAGLEELVAYLRVAKSIGMVSLEENESVEIKDKQGVHLRASIPTFILSADLFPDNLDELVL
ncbi:DUF3375 domain-containing protein [Xenorhabdus budapestensis]|uniref:DUF3375 domain-containing protein n=1 Tax=Xenorhabdus budapestensis TaxID=290110 RepID=A0A2D0J2E3_XENBU|nr:DUF3375 domain-containing protein [Xenorhabdus budapestensis]PHM28527.1 hypothetical protein Xbud_01538 [Xenorhabdus budapestensis]QTL41561.1 DUF3375 domain-containing protein [Xenorhabdus budapestensis]